MKRHHFLRPTSCILLAILLLAAFLRFYRLDAQSFWNDEGNSARIAERTLNLIVEGAAGDIHPPGYYLLLHAWRAAFGQSEFALRSLSALAGLLLVALTYRLGRRLFGEATGLTAAFLGAISPFAIYYSQEARMYTLLGMLSAAAVYLLIRSLPDETKSKKQEVRNKNSASCILHLASYVLVSAAGLYTQYAFALVLLVHNAIFAVWWLAVARRSAARWRWLVTWAGVQVATAMLYLPWLPTALRSVTGWPSAEQAYVLGPALLNVLRWLAVGHTLPPAEAGGALIGAGAMLIAGLWPRKRRWFSVASLALYLLLPIALIFALDLYKNAWLKFLIVVLPPFHILVAHGATNLVAVIHHRTRNTRYGIRIAYCVFLPIFLALLVYPSWLSLHNLYFDPAYARDDYRRIAADIATAPPDSAVILNAPNQWEVFTYYYPDRNVYPAPYHPDPERVEPFLSPLIEQYDRLFVLYWGDAESDPQRLVEARLATYAYKADDRWYGRVRLSTYGAAKLPEEPAIALDALFGENIRLQGYALAGERHYPGDVLPVTLFWEAQASNAEPHKVTVQLLDGAGQLVAQHDGEPAAGFAPTTAWEPGRVVVDRHGILLPTELAPGRYTLVVAVYRAYTGERLPTTLDGQSVGDHLSLGNVEIAPSP